MSSRSDRSEAGRAVPGAPGRRPAGLALLVAAALATLAPGEPAFAQTLKAGFTRKVPGIGFARQSRPVLANLGLGGGKSIVFGTSGPLPAGNPGGVPTGGGSLVVVNADGTVAAGFPVQLPTEVNSVAVGDLDGNGIGDVLVVGYGSTFAGASVPGGLRAYDANGTLRWDRPGGDFDGNGVAEAVYSTPAIADVDGDGIPEVAWGGYDGYVYLADLSTGADRPGWPIFVRDTVWSSPALHDLDGDGNREIVIGVDAHAGDIVLGVPTPDGGCLWAFRPGGTALPGFPYCVDMVIWSSPAVGDVDGDGRPEIVFGTGDCTVANGCVASGAYAYTHELYAVETTGADTPGWPVSVDGEVKASPALADLDGDGVLDVVAVDFPTAAGGKSKVYAFRGNGAQVFKTTLRTVIGVDSFVGDDPIVADVHGDASPEILVPYNWEAVVVSATGTVLSGGGGPSYSTWGPVTGVAAGDMENDGVAIEVAVASSTAGFPGGSVSETEVWAWSPKLAAAPPWGAFREGERRLGVAPGTPPGPPPPAPEVVVTGISPRTGPTAGGTLVAIVGSGFAAGATVTVGGVAATNVAVAGPTSLTARTPARVAGPADVSVSIPGGETGTLPGGFLYTATGGTTRFYSTVPCRLLDTRGPVGAFGGPALSALSTRTFDVPAGACGIPSDAAGVSLNATIADATGPGSLTIYPGSGPAPGTNTISFRLGKNRANNVVIGLSGGLLSIRNLQPSGSVNLIVDVNGYFR